MNTVKVEIVPHPDGNRRGQAIMRLNGLWLLPDRTAFSIDPLLADPEAETPEDWPIGEHSPVETAIGQNGLELTIGPSLVDCPALSPGVPVILRLPSADVRAEMRWPNLPLSIPEAQAPAVMTASQHSPAAREAAAGRARQDREKQIVESWTPHLELKPEPAIEKRPASGLSMLSRHAISMASSSTAGAQAFNGTEVAGAAQRSTAVDAGWDAAAKPDTVLPLYGAVHGASQSLASDSAPARTAAAASSASLSSMPDPVPAMLVEARRERQAVVKADPVQTRTAPKPNSPFVAVMLGIASAAALALIAVFGPAGPALRDAAVVVPAAGPLSLGIPLRDVMTPGDVSPLGQPAATVSLDDALSRADIYLHGSEGKAADRDEAKFWLRHALGKFSADKRLTWVQSQLGTLYAQSAASPANGADFERARALWELAAAQKDPIATCFLAAITEDGLGTALSKDKALALYQDAKALGGCRGIDDKIKRLSK